MGTASVSVDSVLPASPKIVSCRTVRLAFPSFCVFLCNWTGGVIRVCICLILNCKPFFCKELSLQHFVMATEIGLIQWPSELSSSQNPSAPCLYLDQLPQHIPPLPALGSVPSSKERAL